MLFDPALQALMKRIGVAISDALPDSQEFPAEVRITTTSGETLVHRTDVPPGGSTRPSSDTDIAEKFRDCAGHVLPPATIERVLHDTVSLDSLSDVGQFCINLEGPPSADGRYPDCGVG